jgi:predicted HNH restriction endonuclease
MSKGRELSKELGISCKQALFSEWGNFYAPIKAYPCVLFDKAGFIVINSPEEIESLGIKIGKRTNVQALISSLPTYQLISAWKVKLAEEVIKGDSHTYYEGALVSINVNRYERDQVARNKCLRHYGFVCQACGLELSTVYGAVAEEFIHVHHLTKISSIGREYQLDPISDLKPLCPNCHAIAHLRNDPYSIVEIQEMISKCRKNI